MIVPVANGFVVKSEDGSKTLSKKYANRAAALKRLRQIEFFKRKGK